MPTTGGGRSSATHRRRATGPTRGLGRGCTGFTLIESLLVIAIIGILIAQLAPTIHGVRRRAKEIADLSNLRSHVAVITSYAADAKDAAPYFVNPRATLNIVRCTSLRLAVPAKYFEAREAWHIALCDGYYNGALPTNLFISPLAPVEAFESPIAVRSSYRMPCCFFGDPGFWNVQRRRPLPEQLRAVRLSEVLYPSRKSLVVDYLGTSRAAGARAFDRPVGFVDGSAAMVKEDAAGACLGDGQTLEEIRRWGGHSGDWYLMQCVADGVRGMDRVQ